MKVYIGKPLTEEPFEDSKLSFRVAAEEDHTYIVATLDGKGKHQEVGSVEITNRRQENLILAKNYEGNAQIKNRLEEEAKFYLLRFPRSPSLNWFPRPASPIYNKTLKDSSDSFVSSRSSTPIENENNENGKNEIPSLDPF